MIPSRFHPIFSYWDHLFAASLIPISPLHFAAQTGDLNTIKQLLRENPRNINAKIEEGFTPLHVAIQNSQLDVSLFLIKNGADVNAKDDQDWTPLHNATNNGFSLKVVKELIAKGTNVNAIMNKGKIPLHLAAEWNHLEITKLLIESGSDIKAIDMMKWTPLHCAAYGGHFEITKLLIDKGADMDAKTIKCSTPLHFAADHNHLDVVKQLLKSGANVNIADHTKWTALHFAAEKGYDNIVNILLKYKANVNARDNATHDTPLHRAAAYGHIHIVNTLVENGADINATTDFNYTPLLLAVVNKRSETVFALLKQGAMIDVDNTENLPKNLMKHCFGKDFNCFLEIIKTFFAEIKKGNYEIVHNLMRIKKENLNEFLAFLHARNNQGQTLIQVALLNKHVDIASALTHALREGKTQESGTNPDNITGLMNSCNLSGSS